MPPSKPSPRKRKPDVMDLDEMAQDPSLKGMLSFLQTTPEVARERHEARVRVDQAESKQTEVDSTPAVSPQQTEYGGGVIEHPTRVDSSRAGTARVVSPDSDIRETARDVSTRVEISPFVYRRPRIREAPTSQDGHSLGEQALYDALYRAAAPYSQDARIITIGFTRMSELARLAYRNCKINTRALVAKLALEPVSESSFTQGRTYVVYGPETILKRRREAGLTHVIKTRGVIFVDPQTGESLLPAPDDSTRVESTRDEVGGTIPAVLLQGFRQMIPALDGAMVRQLWEQCQLAAGDCTPEEVLYYAELKLRQTTAAGKPVGNAGSYLLAVVPGCFAGPDAIHLGRRRAMEAQKRQQESELLSQRAEWERLVSDRSTPESERRYYEKLLGKKEQEG